MAGSFRDILLVFSIWETPVIWTQQCNASTPCLSWSQLWLSESFLRRLEKVLSFPSCLWLTHDDDLWCTICVLSGTRYSHSGRNNDVDQTSHMLTIATRDLFNELDKSIKPVAPMQFWMVCFHQLYNQLVFCLNLHILFVGS